MASQDETPTHQSTAGGEPPNGTEASALSPEGAPAANGSSAAGSPEPAGPDEHADWDAEFNGFTGSGRTEAEAAADEAGDAPEAVEEPAEESSPEAPEDPASPALSESTSNHPGADDTAGAAGTVPGGHPSVAQRSQLPMRPASTMPDLSGYASAAEDRDSAEDRDNAEDGDDPEDGDNDAVNGDRPVPAEAPAATAVSASAAERPHAVPAGAHEAGRNESETDSDTDSDGPQDGDTETVRTAHDDDPSAEPEPAEWTRTAVTPVVSGSSRSERDADADADADVHDDGDTDADTEGTGNDTDSDADPALSSAEAERRAREREKAAAGKPVLARVLQVMIAVFFPVMVMAAAIRAVATPLFLWAEYHRPGFPADSYGFSTDDRMTYGSYAMDYLLNWSGSRYLGDLVGDGGEPLYLDSEVSHMADVKTVLTIAFVAATVMAVLSLVAALYLARRSPGGIRRSLFSGAVLTLVLVAALVVLAVLGWEQFFTQVHTIFFANGNWTFRLDDTLIRLFPAQFWMDAGITIAALVLLTCAVVLVCCWPTRARRERVRQAREDARRRYAESLEAL